MNLLIYVIWSDRFFHTVVQSCEYINIYELVQPVIFHTVAQSHEPHSTLTT